MDQGVLFYLREVLGIKSFISSSDRGSSYDLSSIPTPEKASSKFKLGFIFSTLNFEENELFQKILAAIKLTPEDVTFLVTSETGVLDYTKSDFWVDMRDNVNEMGIWLKGEGYQVLNTHSLSSMLKKPDLKRQVWSHLKYAMESI